MSVAAVSRSNRMQSWEERFKRDTGFADRSQYKIFYCGVRPAPVLILGINPGADPAEVAPNGVDRVGKGPPHAASTTFHEKDEHDLLDCNWQRTEKLVEFLLEILDSDDTKQVRSSVIMANLAFERARKSSEIDDLPKAMDAAQPILQEIIDCVRPELILLTGAKVSEFTSRYCNRRQELAEPLREANQVVFWPWSVQCKGQTHPVLAVQVAPHAQFGWSYAKHGVAAQIKRLQKAAKSGRR